MKPRHRRLAFLTAGLVAAGVAAWLVTGAFRENLVFFRTPTEVAAGGAPARGSFRVGGMVEEGSVRHGPAPLEVRFTVTDFHRTLPVRYTGTLPDLFREGQGVVAEGVLRADGSFEAHKVLAKHDEKYMPPEVARAVETGRAAGAPTARP
jgi:cytochrome c-type biogenesis protein CcmE